MKKEICILIALAMTASLLGGCGGNSAAAPSASQPEQTETAAASPSQPSPTETPAASQAAASQEPIETQAAPEESAAPSPAADVADLSLVSHNTYTLPISQEKITYSIYSEWPPVLQQFGDNPGDTSYVIKALEDLTNVHLEWKMVSTEEATEMFNIMIVSGDYCDIIQGASGSYTGGADKAVDDGVILDLTDYVSAADMPNLTALLGANSQLNKAMHTTEGRIVAFPKIYEKLEGTPGGLVARKDWIDELDLEIPQTYDEFHDFLTAFYTEKNATNTLLMSYTGYLNRIFNGYGVPGFGSSAFYVENGVVNYSGLDQNYYDLVKMLAGWYSEGILDKEFYTRTNTRDADTGCITSGAAGVWDSSIQQISVTAAAGGFTLTALPDPVLDEAGTGYLQTSDVTWTSYPWNLSTQCHDVDTLVKWFDYLYSQDGSFIANYGAEGDTFYYNESGEPRMADLVIANPSGFPAALLESVYTVGAFPFVYNWEKYTLTYDETQKAAYRDWNAFEPVSDRWTYPSGAVLSADDQIEAANIMSDIETYMEELYFRVVLGEDGVSALDGLADQLQTMNISRVLTLKQQAYDAYMAQ